MKTFLADLYRPPCTEDGKWLRLDELLEAFERQMIQHALDMARGNQALAARLCGHKRTTFIEKINKYQIYHKFDESESNDDFKHRMSIYSLALKNRAEIVDRVIKDINENAELRKKSAIALVG